MEYMKDAEMWKKSSTVCATLEDDRSSAASLYTAAGAGPICATMASTCQDVSRTISNVLRNCMDYFIRYANIDTDVDFSVFVVVSHGTNKQVKAQCGRISREPKKFTTNHIYQMWRALEFSMESHEMPDQHGTSLGARVEHSQCLDRPSFVVSHVWGSREVTFPHVQSFVYMSTEK